MKKLFFLLGIILISVYVFLSILDTSDYALEKRLWHVQKEFLQIKKDPQVVPDQHYENVIGQYERIIKKFPNSDLTPQIFIQIGKIYVLKKDYNSARASYLKILEQYPDSAVLCSRALFHVGLTYELEKNETKAIESFQRLYKDYPLTTIGLNAPLYISNFYKKNNKLSLETQSLNQAVSFYRSISQQFSGTQTEFNALRLLGAAYLALNEWENAVNVFTKILLEFSTKEYMSAQRIQILSKSINTVCIIHLKNYDRAISIYQDFIDHNPKSILSKYFKKMVLSLEELKNKGVDINIKAKDE